MISNNFIEKGRGNHAENLSGLSGFLKTNYIIENWDKPKDEFLDGKKAMLIADLKCSGLIEETVRDAKLEIFEGSSDDLKRLIGFSSIGGQSIIQACSVLKIPYFDNVGNIIYYRVRLYPELNGAKYLTPAGSESIPYILPAVWESKDKKGKEIWITEGEKKTLKILQEGELAIGLQGVANFKPAKKENTGLDIYPDILEFCIPGRTFYIAYDSDFIKNPDVRYHMFKLAFTLFLNKVKVKIATWTQENKGIDDYLSAGGVILSIKDNATLLLSYIEKNKDYVEDAIKALKAVGFEADSIELGNRLIIDSLAKCKITKRMLNKFLYKPAEKLENPKKDENVDENGYKIPFGFLKNENKLAFIYILKETEFTSDICDYFIVNKIIKSENNTFINIKFENKEFKANASVIGDGRELSKIFNENGVFVVAEDTKKITKFIKEFIDINANKILKIIEYDRIGYDKSDNYLAPTLNINDNITFTDDINLKIARKGDAGKQIEFLKNIFINHAGASLIVSAGLAGLLIKPLNLNNFVIFTSGRTGTGKTLASQVMLSILGNPDRLKNNLNSTAVGAEILFSKFLDFPILLDELETAQTTAEKINNTLVNLIYSFQSGIGRTRSQKNLHLRETAIYRGLLFITSERSVSSVLSDNSTQKANLGVYRRTLEINDKIKLFADNVNYAEIADKINKNYGHILPVWINYIKNNAENIKSAFHSTQEYIKNANLGGKQDIIALISICHDLFLKEILKVGNNNSEFNNLLSIILKENKADFHENVLNEYEKYKNAIKEFTVTSGKFLNKIQEKKDGDNYHKPLGGIIGQIEIGDDDNILYFYTNKAMELLCKEYKFEQKRLLESLKEKGVLISGDEKGKFTRHKKIDGSSIRCYWFMSTDR